MVDTSPQPSPQGEGESKEAPARCGGFNYINIVKFIVSSTQYLEFGLQLKVMLQMIAEEFDI